MGSYNLASRLALEGVDQCAGGVGFYASTLVKSRGRFLRLWPALCHCRREPSLQLPVEDRAPNRRIGHGLPLRIADRARHAQRTDQPDRDVDPRIGVAAGL